MSTYKSFFSMITFQCRECGVVIKVLIRNNSKLTFSFVGKLHSESQCLTENGYFKCVMCKNIDNTKRFEKVWN